MNVIPATVTGSGTTTTVELKGGATATLDIATAPGDVGRSASFGVRPEDLRITSGGDFLFEGTVSIVEALGEVTLLYIEGLVEGEPIIAKIPGIQSVTRGDSVRFTADRSKLHLFDDEGKSYRAK